LSDGAGDLVVLRALLYLRGAAERTYSHTHSCDVDRSVGASPLTRSSLVVSMSRPSIVLDRIAGLFRILVLFATRRHLLSSSLALSVVEAMPL
jgi:hypothetical protein